MRKNVLHTIFYLNESCMYNRATRGHNLAHKHQRWGMKSPLTRHLPDGVIQCNVYQLWFHRNESLLLAFKQQNPISLTIVWFLIDSSHHYIKKLFLPSYGYNYSKCKKYFWYFFEKIVPPFYNFWWSEKICFEFVASLDTTLP